MSSTTAELESKEDEVVALTKERDEATAKAAELQSTIDASSSSLQDMQAAKDAITNEFKGKVNKRSTHVNGIGRS